MRKINIRQRRELESILSMASVDEDLLADAISDLIVDRDEAQRVRAELETARLAEAAHTMNANSNRVGTPHAEQHVQTIACHAPPRCKHSEPAKEPEL